MAKAFCDNLTYLAAKLHARRSRMLEGNRLEALCHIRSLSELGQAVGLDADNPAAAELQRQWVKDLVRELAGFVKHLGEAGSGLFSSLLLRFQIENVKVLIRGVINKIPLDSVQSYLAPLPESMALDLPKLMAANSLEDLLALLPRERLYERLRATPLTQRDQLTPFHSEMALENGYFQQLLSQTGRLSDEDLAAVRPLVWQEANLFQFMLGTRGKFLYQLPPESLLPWRLGGLLDAWFKELLAAPDLLTAAKSSVGIVLDELPSGRGSTGTALEPATLEALAWKRYARLANLAFRRGNMGLGAVFGYAGLRRVEVANLITLSEGIRMRLANGELRERLIDPTYREAIHV
jgi:V/A-type H+/Na+-transporting ATPase subunit C